MGNVDHKIGSWNFATPQHFHDFKLTKTDRRRISTRFSTLASQKGLSVWNQYSLFLYLFRNVSFHRQVLSGSGDKKVKADRRQTVTHSWSWCDPRQDRGWPPIGWLDQSRDWRLASYWLNHVRPEPGSLLRCRDCCPGCPHPPDGEYWLQYNLLLGLTSFYSAEWDMREKCEYVVMTSPSEMIVARRYLMLIVILITFKLRRHSTVTTNTGRLQ